MRWTILILLLLAGCKSKGDKSYTPTSEIMARLPDKPRPSPQPPMRTVADELASAASLPAALQVMRGRFGDTTDKLDPGATVFAIWAAKQALWSEIQRQPETKHGLVLKDPDPERGKKLCSSGTIAEIHADKSAGPTLYTGGIVSNSMKVTRFIAVGSTGEIVENSIARICGVVTGVNRYSNSGGGTTEAVHIVGMFDLPANK